MAFDIQISTGSAVPIYRQIMDQVRRAIASGELVVGDQLPSVRSLAERLLLNQNTVARAFNELTRDGIIESQHGRGAFVARRRQVYARAERLRRLENAIDALLSEALLLDFSREEILKAIEAKLDAMERQPTITTHPSQPPLRGAATHPSQPPLRGGATRGEIS